MGSAVRCQSAGAAPPPLLPWARPSKFAVTLIQAVAASSVARIERRAHVAFKYVVWSATVLVPVLVLERSPA